MEVLVNTGLMCHLQGIISCKILFGVFLFSAFCVVEKGEMKATSELPEMCFENPPNFAKNEPKK